MLGLAGHLDCEEMILLDDGPPHSMAKSLSSVIKLNGDFDETLRPSFREKVGGVWMAPEAET